MTSSPSERRLALALILGAAAWRVLTVTSVPWANISPVMALAYCGGLYFESAWLWTVPFAAVAASDGVIDRYYAVTYHYHYGWGGMLIHFACLAAALGFGRLVARRPHFINGLSGILASSLLFYLVTNTGSWWGDAGYAHTAAGWWQAMTVGHPEYPPTLYFFRNTFCGDLLFAGLFAAAMAAVRRRVKPPVRAEAL